MKEWIELKGHSESVFSVVFSRDNQLVCSGGDDRVVRIFEINKREEIHRLEGYTYRIFSLAIEGNRLITQGIEGLIRVYDLESGEDQ